MLAVRTPAPGRAHPSSKPRITFVQGEAEALPFDDGEFDALTFTYLLRYVDDRAATMRELARVVKPGAKIGMVEFGVPESPPLRAAWRVHTRAGLPLLGRAVSPAWFEVGRFLGPNIEELYAQEPDLPGCGASRESSDVEQRQHELRSRARDVGSQERSWRARPVSSSRPAFYALRSGGWRDLVTLLHPPYTVWHLSYVALGAAAAPHIYANRLAAALVAFFLAVGISAHALDELHGRPLGTKLRRSTLIALAACRFAGAIGIGIAGIVVVSPLLVPLVLAGGLLVPAYNLELAGGRFHNDTWFAVAWGGFPAFTGYFVNALTIRPAGVLVAARVLPVERWPSGG